MSERIALVSCVKTQQGRAAPAGELYISPLFRAIRRYATSQADAWYILSPKHGLLKPGDVIDPYDLAMQNLDKAQRITWAKRVQEQLREALPADCEVILLAGKQYRDAVEPALRKRGIKVTVPLEGLGLGEQLQWLNKHVPSKAG